MDAQKVDMFIMSNQKNLPADKIVYLREKMLAADEGKFALLTTVDIKDSTTLLIISIFLGYLGIDRFMLGDIGMGILKLLTCGVCGILTIIDWFTVLGDTVSPDTGGKTRRIGNVAAVLQVTRRKRGGKRVSGAGRIGFVYIECRDHFPVQPVVDKKTAFSEPYDHVFVVNER